jgi:hypothetical protein
LTGTVVAVAVGVGDAVGADDDVAVAPGDADVFTLGEADDTGATLAPGSGELPTVAPPLHAASNMATKITDVLRINMTDPLRRMSAETYRSTPFAWKSSLRIDYVIPENERPGSPSVSAKLRAL